MHALTKRCHECNIKLNKEKAQLQQKEVPFIGHVITNEGLKAHSEKLRAVMEMPTPTDVAGVQRFIGFTNYLRKFLSKLSAECEPVWKPTVKDTEWSWTSVHETAVNRIKQLVSKAPVLKYYNTGLGATLLQKGQPIAFASRALIKCERNYTQLRKSCWL